MSWPSRSLIKRYYVSETTVYRPLKVHVLIASSAFIVLKAANELEHKTTANNQLWQTDFTYLKVMGWAGFFSAEFWTNTAATSTLGNSARTCGQRMCQTDLTRADPKTPRDLPPSNQAAHAPHQGWPLHSQGLRRCDGSWRLGWRCFRPVCRVK